MEFSFRLDVMRLAAPKAVLLWNGFTVAVYWNKQTLLSQNYRINSFLIENEYLSWSWAAF